jgi:hypothetical protein
MKPLKKLLAAALISTLPLGALAQTSPPPPAEPAKPAAKVEDAVKVTPYGFVLGNAYWSTETFSSRTYPGQVQATNEGGSFNMTAAQSRFGVRLATKDTLVTGADITGVIEFDFNGGNLSGTSVNAAAPSSAFYNGLMRLRLAAATATWKTPVGNASLLVGQDYGLVNPLFAESLAWVASPLFWQAGNIWRRSPQVRATFNPKISDQFGLLIQAAILSPADASSPVDFGAGNRSRQPDLEGRVAINARVSPDMNGTVGFGYHTNERRYLATPAAGTTPASPGGDLTVSGYGVDLELNVPFLAVKGEWYKNDGLEDTYFGVIGNPVGVVGGTSRVKVETDGYWAQGIVKLVPALWLTIGYGAASADEGDLGRFVTGAAAAGQRIDNSQLAAGVLVNAGKFWRVGVEWVQVETEYLNNVSNTAQQIAFSSQLKF